MMHYFAYGSNLHPVRLRERVPSAKLIGALELRRHRLVFHKRGVDGSGKCTLIDSGVVTESVHGALYELDTAHKTILDQFESKGDGYLDNLIRLHREGQKYTCFTYLAQESHIDETLKPYHWYKKLVVLGARYLQFPDAYVASIESVDSTQDPDRDRRTANRSLLEKITRHR
jgi:gamma-glutamylcyclotransferase (GGCT)/AIG2-like uncharacterized protein YtfP